MDESRFGLLGIRPRYISNRDATRPIQRGGPPLVGGRRERGQPSAASHGSRRPCFPTDIPTIGMVTRHSPRRLLHYRQECHASGAAARATATASPPETGIFPCAPTGGRFRIRAV